MDIHGQPVELHIGYRCRDKPSHCDGCFTGPPTVCGSLLLQLRRSASQWRTGVYLERSWLPRQLDRFSDVHRDRQYHRDHITGGNVKGVAVNPSGTHIYVANSWGGVYVIDAWSNKVVAYVSAGTCNKQIAMGPAESVSTPPLLTGASSGTINASYTYSISGSSSNYGHPVQYLFDWGDGTNSAWLPVGQASASKSWRSHGTYSVKAQARCSTDTSVVSGWSSGLSVTIFAPSETISIPSTLGGQLGGNTGANSLLSKLGLFKKANLDKSEKYF